MFYLNSEEIYLISPFGLGDTYILCMYKDAIEKCYQHSVVYVIKPSHVDILSLFGYKFIVRNFSEKELGDIAKSNNVINAGKFYVAHPHYVDKLIEKEFFDKNISFAKMYCRTLGIPENSSYQPACNYLKHMVTLEEKIKPLKVDDVVLFAPEMNSCRTQFDRPSHAFLKRLNKILYDKYGNNLIVNAIGNTMEYFGKKIDLSLMELVVLATSCRKVVSIRSGLCDVLYTNVKSMDVIYGNQDFYDGYALESLFSQKINPYVNEYIISYANILRDNGFNSCAIYGWGENGRRLYRTLRHEGYEVVYVIDRREKEISIDIDVYGLDVDKYPYVDCIIVTVNGSYDEIKQEISAQAKDISIINLYELDISNTNDLCRKAGNE